MKNNTDYEKNERIFDSMLKIVAGESLREELDELPNDEELVRMFPTTESLDKKAYAVINREFRGINRRRILRAFTRAAAAICIVLVLSASVLMATPASRNFILNILIDVRHDHVALDFGLVTTPSENDYDTFTGYVPEGFSLVSRQTLDTLITDTYGNDEGHIIIVQRFLGRSLTAGIDNEYADFSEIELSGGIAHISIRTYEYDFSTIMWVHGEDIISISTTLDTEALIELAENYMSR